MLRFVLPLAALVACVVAEMPADGSYTISMDDECLGSGGLRCAYYVDIASKKTDGLVLRNTGSGSACFELKKKDGTSDQYSIKNCDRDEYWTGYTWSVKLESGIKYWKFEDGPTWERCHEHVGCSTYNTYKITDVNTGKRLSYYKTGSWWLDLDNDDDVVWGLSA